MCFTAIISTGSLAAAVYLNDNVESACGSFIHRQEEV
jgi:hypothetical protein